MTAACLPGATAPAAVGGEQHQAGEKLPEAGGGHRKLYLCQIEAKSRKTDPWMALVASMVGEPALGGGQAAGLPLMGAVKL